MNSLTEFSKKQHFIHATLKENYQKENINSNSDTSLAVVPLLMRKFVLNKIAYDHTT